MLLGRMYEIATGRLQKVYGSWVTSEENRIRNQISGELPFPLAGPPCLDSAQPETQVGIGTARLLGAQWGEGRLSSRKFLVLFIFSFSIPGAPVSQAVPPAQRHEFTGAKTD